jgi:cytochrome c peroxidase
MLLGVASCAQPMTAVSLCGEPPPGTERAPNTFVPCPTAPAATGPIAPVAAPALDRAKVALGERLFHDRRLSRDATISCSSCHDLARAGVDGATLSRGVGGAFTTTNSPTVINAGLDPVQRWDGGSETIEAQIDRALTGAREMASSWPDVVARVGRDPGYREAFARSYRGGIGRAQIEDAIATFVRSLVTVSSRFDRFLGGDTDAITVEELKGYRLFRDLGCASCHQGANVGGNMFATMGVMGDYFADRGDPTEADNGRYNVTHRDQDRHVFRVPPLRLAADTAPYFHDGSAETLSEAIRVMARYQLGRTVTPDERALIIAFLGTLR